MMKLWLFDILACPIDKYYPLELYIFSIETQKKALLSFIKIFQKRNLEVIKESGIMQIIKEKNNFFIKDSIIVEKTQIKEYLEKLLESIEEFENIKDMSNMESFDKSLDIIKNHIKPTLSSYFEEKNYDSIESIHPELYFLNKVKLNIEIESGLLFCEECKRWYPIIETIPQMLPDEYRDKEKDLQFLKNNKNLLIDKLIELPLKPYDL
jgi:uncharacterized protein YbaR (Trm112 family)